jgi:hypothetical protein
MSIAALDQDTRTTTDLDLGLIEAVESAVPCQIDLCFSTPEPECPNSPAFMVTFKSMCDHHGDIAPGDPMVCGSHAAWLASGKYGCGGCKCRVELVGGWQHLIISFKEI